MTEQQKALEEHRQAEQGRAERAAEARTQLGLGRTHAHDSLPRQTGGGGTQ